MTMDVTRTHAARLPPLDQRWTPRPFEREELIRGLVDGRVATEEVSHAMDNVRRNIGLLCDGDPDKQFGMTGLQTFTPSEVFELVAKEAGFDPDPTWLDGPVPIEPDLVLDACASVGDRLAEAVGRRERMIIATGHPVGLAHLYVEVGRLVRSRGVEILEPFDRVWFEDRVEGTDRQVRYLEGVAMVTDGESMRHTHRADAMTAMLEEARPDLVFADHGFAGAAIERGVETLSIADVNDPALVVAKAQGRTDVVIVMDDNVHPEDYWPCFQAIVARVT
jgi:Phosphatase